RRQIEEWGGEFYFNTKLTKIHCHGGKLVGISCVDTGNGKKEAIKNSAEKTAIPREISTGHLILAIGHSARDTLEMLKEAGLSMEAKAFAVGVRVEHEQDFINRAQYKAAAGKLPAADYKLTYTAKNGRGIYSFCMCPGGYVVNASSEEGHLVVNGMSNYSRAGRNANSALIVTVTPEDFAGLNKISDPLSGMYFQRHFEALAYHAAQGKIPFQLYGDLLNGRKSSGYGRIIPCHKGAAAGADLRGCLPDFAVQTLLEGMQAFDRMLPGFADEEAVFSGVEMRTSSPVRLLRDGQFQSNIKGIYPCGEGAGYAGGIMSAAVDGIKVFEAVAASFLPGET
ncbi:MAG: FAD-dependent oxidoreductase, partial [Lachnospiraceae bacterium]|nr:FAD-dependent oxidoreductase [Lachnospiraceae bacterium]